MFPPGTGGSKRVLPPRTGGSTKSSRGSCSPSCAPPQYEGEHLISGGSSGGSTFSRKSGVLPLILGGSTRGSKMLSLRILQKFLHDSHINRSIYPYNTQKFSRASRENLNIPFKIHKNIRSARKNYHPLKM